MTRAFTLSVPESSRPLLKAPREPWGNTIGGGVEQAWYAEVRATFQAKVDGCELQPGGELHVLRPTVLEHLPGGASRLKSTYWPAVEERLPAAGLSRAQFESCMRAAWHMAMLEAEVTLRESYVRAWVRF